MIGALAPTRQEPAPMACMMLPMDSMMILMQIMALLKQLKLGVGEDPLKYGRRAETIGSMGIPADPGSGMTEG